MASATCWNVSAALVPMAWIAVKQTITIRASITAYSTAVGPSSDLRNCCTFLSIFILGLSFRTPPCGRRPIVVESCCSSRWTALSGLPIGHTTDRTASSQNATQDQNFQTHDSSIQGQPGCRFLIGSDPRRSSLATGFALISGQHREQTLSKPWKAVVASNGFQIGIITIVG